MIKQWLIRGDCHGQFTWLDPRKYTNPEETAIIILGDAGFNFYLSKTDTRLKKETENIVTVRGMLEELKETWEGALVQLLKEYQAAHPEDADLKSALTDIGEKPAAASAQPQSLRQQQGQTLKQPAAASAYNNMPKAQPKIITQQPQQQNKRSQPSEHTNPSHSLYSRL